MNEFKVKIPDILKEAFVKGKVKFSIHYEMNFFGKIVKKLTVKKISNSKIFDFYLDETTSTELDTSIKTFLYEDSIFDNN